MRPNAVVLILACSLGAAAAGRGETRMLDVELRSRVEQGGAFGVRTAKQRWRPAETAVIICDMWDRHWCAGANRRGAELAPRMNRLIGRLRERGVLVIHAPSGCMDFYRDHPGRRLAQAAPPAANRPPEIEKWCYRIPSEEKGAYPLDQEDGGCDDVPMCRTYNAWKSQMPALEIREGDAISDSGVEIWNLLESRGIKNVLIMGVHLNMCVLGRPFGLRNMARAGKNVALVRDMTDTMYNPRSRPYVSHYRGTELMVEHVEKWVCPSVTSDQFLGGRPFRFRDASD